ncbi:hypothetical protein O988_09604, partial [Pseudogymnoascus sp. VKM F-3808]
MDKNPQDRARPHASTSPG